MRDDSVGCAALVLALALGYVLVRWANAGFPGLGR